MLELARVYALTSCEFIAPLNPSREVLKGAGGGIEATHGSLAECRYENWPKNDIITAGRKKFVKTWGNCQIAFMILTFKYITKYHLYQFLAKKYCIRWLSLILHQ